MSAVAREGRYDASTATTPQKHTLRELHVGIPARTATKQQSRNIRTALLFCSGRYCEKLQAKISSTVVHIKAIFHKCRQMLVNKHVAPFACLWNSNDRDHLIFQPYLCQASRAVLGCIKTLKLNCRCFFPLRRKNSCHLDKIQFEVCITATCYSAHPQQLFNF